MSENLPALGYCPKCRDMMITANGVPKCFNCEPSVRPKHIVKPPPVSSKAISNKDLKDMGVKVGKEVGTTPTPRKGTAKEALEIMQNLPMPKDEKEFKKIRKIIALIEKFIGEQE